MSDDEGASERPERTERQMEIQRLARQRAAEQGKVWKDMSKDERKALRKAVAAEVPKDADDDTAA